MAKPTARPHPVIDAPPRLPMRGHPLSDDEFHKATPAVAWAPRLEYAWDTGAAMDGLRAGKIYGVQCRTYLTPRRIWNVQVNPSAEVSQDSASPGTYRPSEAADAR